MAKVMETDSMESTTISYTSLALMIIALVYPAFDTSVKQHFLRKIEIILEMVMSSKLYRIMITLIFSKIFFQIIISNVSFINVLLFVLHLINILYIACGVRTLTKVLSIELRALLPNNICITKMYHLKFGNRTFLIIYVVFSILDIFCYILCGTFGLFCLCSKDGILNHLVALSNIMTEIECPYNIKRLYTLFYSLILYYVYWYHNNILTVIQSCDDCIKLFVLIFFGIRVFQNLIQL